MIRPTLRKIKYFTSAVLPLGALAIYLAFGPVPSSAAQCVCYYGGAGYSPGANISDNCGGAKVQTCDNNNGSCSWSTCHPPSQ